MVPALWRRLVGEALGPVSWERCGDLADVAIRDADGQETTVALRQGDVFVVPKGTQHKPSSTGGSILMFEPTGTTSTGDRHEGSIPDHVDSTPGRDLPAQGRLTPTRRP